ncbi:MAG: TIGR04283 family arsenosugar biosynthesis glycosyltransferase [Gammaproteobacteria bacterium]|nr:TIGR04283 family arsenosugar biosynthesis glycosyltransferase [Gammaproteobacteria bacterium]
MMVSVIIPVLNEQKALPQTLTSLLKQQCKRKWLREIIIVDGGSHDASLSIAKKFGQSLPIKIIRATRGRASQMNAGAQAASSPWLLFLHADTQLPQCGLQELYQATCKPGVVAACFKHSFSGKYWGLGFISWLHNLRFRRTKIMYGDQAIFVAHTTFFEIGGFPEQDAEDILFSKKLLAIATPLMLNATITTDSRKFEQIGTWQALRYVIGIQCQHQRGNAIGHHAFFQNYR